MQLRNKRPPAVIWLDCCIVRYCLSVGASDTEMELLQHSLQLASFQSASMLQTAVIVTSHPVDSGPGQATTEAAPAETPAVEVKPVDEKKDAQEGPTLTKEESEAAVLKMLEFYFGDSNFGWDRFMQSKVCRVYSCCMPPAGQTAKAIFSSSRGLLTE